VFAAAVRRVVAPMFEQQQAFNAAVVDHINRNLPAARQTAESIDTALAALRAHIEALARFESLLIVFLQQITPYVDTRDRDVAGLLRGLSGAINAVADELMKRSEALLARDARREAQLGALEEQIGGARARIDDLVRALPGARDDG
jgi:prophage DNA circulation protein